MNQKITFPELINLVAETTKTSKKSSEDFLKELFSLIAETLVSGENVKIKKLGTFKVIDVEPRKSVNINSGEEMLIPGHKKITFTPDKEFAEAVNSPFSAFESVEISDEVTDEMLGMADNQIDASNEEMDEAIAVKNDNQMTESEETVIEELPQVEWCETTDEKTNSSSDGHFEEGITYSEKDDAIDDSITETVVSEKEFNNEPVQHRSQRTFAHGFVWGVASLVMLIVAVVAVLFFLFPETTNGIIANFNREQAEVCAINRECVAQVSVERNVEENQVSVVNNESNKINDSQTLVANTQPSDQPVYDTISRTRFLTTMAKEHYGNFNLWPYIYEENKQILGHPDRIKPGTRVVIPPKEKYGIDPMNEDCIAKAKQKGVEIYARYKKQ